MYNLFGTQLLLKAKKIVQVCLSAILKKNEKSELTVIGKLNSILNFFFLGQLLKHSGRVHTSRSTGYGFELFLVKVIPPPLSEVCPEIGPPRR